MSIATDEKVRELGRRVMELVQKVEELDQRLQSLSRVIEPAKKAEKTWTLGNSQR